MDQLPICINGLGSIIDQYDAFIIDQWGVIHDGKTLYPGVSQVFKKLNELKKPIVILTNSSKTNEINIVRLNESFGLSRNLYKDIISSADLLLNLILEKSHHPWNKLGKRIFIVAAEDIERSIIDNSELESVSDINEAELVMLLSIKVNQNHENWMDTAIKNQLPLVCPSADIHSVSPNGIIEGMASLVAKYRRSGGYVINVGKPESFVYDKCKKILSGYDLNRILSIGDQLASDIVGAKQNGFHAALVSTGATNRRFPLSKSLNDIAEEVFKLSDPKSLAPEWILKSLCW